MKYLFRLMLGFCAIFCCAVSCTSVSEDDLTIPTGTINGEDVTYTQNIQPIMAASCTECHKDPPMGGAPFPLLTFNQVSNLANQILTAMDNGTMPPAGRLPQSNIDLVAAWIENGLTE